MKGGKSKATKAGDMLGVRKRGEKKAKDPNKPKRPLSAFLVFMEDFRKEFNEENPNNRRASVVTKAGGDKWRSMSVAEKAPFTDKAEKLKAEYLKKVAAYDRGELKNGGADGDESDKSKSEVNDEETEEEDD